MTQPLILLGRMGLLVLRITWTLVQVILYGTAMLLVLLLLAAFGLLDQILKVWAHRR